MMRAAWVVSLALAACAPTLPDSGREAGAGATASSGSGAANDDLPEELSDEQSFEAVSERETIESDRARLEKMEARYRQIAPADLPPLRGADGGPNIVAYALRTGNAVGDQLYSRFNPLRWSLSRRACAGYASGDQAQIAFLAAGGPERDKLNLDPDGDGFACRWDPARLRRIARLTDMPPPEAGAGDIGAEADPG